jgi:hypothetical protein
MIAEAVAGNGRATHDHAGLNSTGRNGTGVPNGAAISPPDGT